MDEINFIENPPTVDDLRSLYESEMYQGLLSDFSRRSRHKLDGREKKEEAILNLLTTYQGRYTVLNIPFDEVLPEFEKNRDDFLNYVIATTDFFIKHDDSDPDGEFPQGEEPDKGDKSVTLESHGISKWFFIDKFCEFYILQTGDKERLLHYLKTTRMPGAKKYAGQITKLYKQALSH